MVGEVKNMFENRYAGDAAWRDWFRICSVAGCDVEVSQRLSSQIRSAMFAQLTRYGFLVEDAKGDDPVAFFDSYFKLKGSRDKGKPLKSYFAYRIASEGMQMMNFVCGTLFGSASGRIHDIVLDWIAALKGWKPRTLRDADGHRRIVWENAGTEDIAQIELAAEDDPCSTVAAEMYRRLASRLLRRISAKIKLEKPKVALLIYVTAQDVPMTEAAILEGLGMGKSRAYALREKAMNCLRNELKDSEEAGDSLFIRMLIETCAENLPEAMNEKTGGEQ